MQQILFLLSFMFKKKNTFKNVKQALSDDPPPPPIPPSLPPHPPHPSRTTNPPSGNAEAYWGLATLSSLCVLPLPGSVAGMAACPRPPPKHTREGGKKHEEGKSWIFQQMEIRRTNWQITWMYTNVIYVELELIPLRCCRANSHLSTTCFWLFF